CPFHIPSVSLPAPAKDNPFLLVKFWSTPPAREERIAWKRIGTR
ncbi:MAG: hypothetical protein AVDCRST_MAG56-5532, partial [uncultured Cytophagales bacterium]